ncbi:IS110 family transposase [Citrifermentans pelophilum]|uniref:IS110 family transposase n=1 Tax=Geoanaerobacter pelophilus TaxID=60036 RepID=UPI001F20135B|nr:transposase [Geoanaerobacter pelophilus]
MIEITIGVYVSKNRVEVAVLPSGAEFSMPHDEASCCELACWLEALNPKLIVLEAAGGVENHVTGILLARDLPVAVINTRQIREFAKATGRLAKSNSIDARILALFGVAVKPEPRRHKNEGAREVTALITRRRQIVDMLAAERNRLASSHNSVKSEIAQTIKWLENRVKRIDDDLSGFIRAMFPVGGEGAL